MRASHSLPAAGLLLALSLSGGVRGLAAQDAGTARDGTAVRSGTRGAAPASGEVATGRYVFAGIGIDDYRSPIAWPRLQNAVNDLTGVREILTAFGFEAPPELQLENAGATKDALENLLPALDGYLEQTDNLVLFFAGHGHTHHVVAGGEVLETTGYIIPHDGGESDRHSWISIESFLNEVALLPARHILVILDSCHSGMALGGTKTRGGATVDGAAGELVSLVSRRVLTSARANEKAMDGGPRPGHSLFTGWLITGLERALDRTSAEPGVDANDDALITTAEIYSFVRNHVESDPEAAQIPDFGTFKLDQRGELMITMEVEPFLLHYDQALRLYRDPARFDVDSAAVRHEFLAAADSALALQPAGASSAYLRFLLAEVNGNDGHALAALEELDAAYARSEEIPMEIADLRMNLAMRRRICEKMVCEAPKDPTQALRPSAPPPARELAGAGRAPPRISLGGIEPPRAQDTR